MRSQRACEILFSEGYTGLFNMQGGVYGGPNASGSANEPGWGECGHPLSTMADPARTWSALLAGQK